MFDFGESVSAVSVVAQPSEASGFSGSLVADNVATAVNAPANPNQSADPSLNVVVDVQPPNGEGEKRIVTYFEEWGVYERDVNLSDVNGQAMTHLNYSFFDVKADGSV